MEPCFKLKLLNGPLSGHEILLPQGTFTLGNDGCDLILPLQGGNDASLAVSPDEVLLNSLTPCWVSGHRHKSGPLPRQVPVDLAGIHFVLALPAEECRSLSVPKRVKTRWAWAWVFTLVVACIAIWIALTPPPAVSPTPRQWLPEALKKTPRLHATWINTGTIALSGRCSDIRQIETLARRLQADNVHLLQNAVCDDEIQRSLKTILADYGYPNASVVLDDNGHASIDGEFGSNTLAVSNALAQTRGLISWQLSDHAADELAALLSEWQGSDILDGLSITRSNGEWMLSGQFDNARQTRLEKFISQFNYQSGRDVSLRYIGSAGHPSATDYLSAPITSIGGSLGALYVQLTNGERLLPGARLRQGMRIFAIFPDGISLVSRHSLIFIPL